ncbi:paraquat-inducible protein A [Aliiglaciecola sp. CAU 1673]|uniref:paraquat-inducible protein A n=1 Tax=Aliiglaciecola sp. CAU 1673 TaxID=3032595 RepID=UPI0023DCB8CA|nr:paraquat-inducible protein A [Aliiglaciecola sp. CAU 1673]MDF2178966.1 paraquat-inducible protein A [Aliiglaciecola sp. CAU 1673]
MSQHAPLTRSVSASHSQEISCHECGLVVNLPRLGHKQKAVCPRCGSLLTLYHQQAIDKILAFSLSGLFFLVASLPFDFMVFGVRGQVQHMSIPMSISLLAEQGYVMLAGIQLAAIYIIPLVILCSLIYLSFFLRQEHYPPRGAWVKKLIFALLPWSMAEIFMMGALISLIKVGDMADIELGMSFYAYVMFTLSLIGAFLYLDDHQLSAQLRRLGELQWHQLRTERAPAKQTIQRTWALLLASTILYVPANLFPIMYTRLLGQETANTILGGVISLWQGGSYPIAIIIFVASVLVPVGKLVAMAWLNYSIQTKSPFVRKWRTQIFRVTDFVGRWSMIDVFVVAILVSLIQLGNSMAVYPGPAAVSFSIVVILTMLAANSFDARLIWEIDNDNR